LGFLVCFINAHAQGDTPVRKSGGVMI